MAKSNAKAMPDGDTVVFWFIRGIIGLLAALEALIDNDIVLSRDASRELLSISGKLDELTVKLSDPTELEAAVSSGNMPTKRKR